MIDEDDLRALLTEAAEAVPPPGRAPQALLDAVAEQATAEPRHRPRRRTLVVAAAAAVVIGVVGLAVAGESSSKDDMASGGRSTQLLEQSAGDVDASDSDDKLAPGEVSTGSPAGATGGTGGAGDGGQQSASVPVAAPSVTPTAAPVGQPSDSAKVIRTGSVDLEVREGAFQSSVERITALTVGFGGYIAEATTSESEDSPSGSITVRVPGDSFDQLLSDLRKLGDVKAVSAKGTDVTAQFTDLEAREKALVATRNRLNAVLAEADTVTDILAVQDRITTVQVEIERVQGEQKLLEDQTEFGTLAITLGEPGAKIIEAKQGDGGLGSAWDDARRRFGDNVESIVSWSGSAAVVLIFGLVALLVGRLLWVGMRRRFV